jgi:hypothetical protein
VTQEATASHYDTADTRHEVSGWAVGAVLFAGVMMVMSGGFQVFSGLVALFEDEFYVATRNYMFQFDATTWGWIHLIGGAVVLAAGFAVMVGQMWARVVGIVLAVLSALANFVFMPYYPFWAITVIAVDIFVVWALAFHGRDVKNATA